MARTTYPPASAVLDMSRVRRYLATAPAVPPSGLVLPDSGVDRDLRELLGRRNLRRALQHVIRLDVDRDAGYAAAMSALMAADDAALTTVGVQPEFTSWLWVCDQAVPVDARDALLGALLPELLATPDLPPVEFTVDADPAGGVALRRLGVQVGSGDRAVTFVVAEGELSAGAGGPVIADATGTRAATGVRPLARLGDHGPWLTAGTSSWLDRHGPTGAEFVTLDDQRFAAYEEILGTAYRALADHCPQWRAEVDDLTQWVLPAREKGHRANNFSVPPFRGLVAMNARPSYLGAQALAHETAHNKMNTILSLTPLCDNPETTVVSPIVDEDRQLNAVFHGVFSFAQDIAVTTRLIDRVPGIPGADMERYLADRVAIVGESLDLLDGEARYTAVGRAVRDEIASIVDDAARR